MLASIVAAPAVIAAGLAFFWASRRQQIREQSETERIQSAKLMFDDMESRVRASFPWATQALEFLGAARLTSARLLEQLRAEASSIAELPIDWSVLSPTQQDAARRLIQLAAVTLTVLPLPALATPSGDLSDDATHTLDRKAAQWNDAVLADAIACAARVTLPLA